MQLGLERDRIRIVPTDEQDVAYIEDTLGLRKNGDTIELKRVNAHNLSSVAHLEARKEVYTPETAHQCPKYKDTHWGGCFFSPSMKEAIQNDWPVIMCLDCIKGDSNA